MINQNKMLPVKVNDQNLSVNDLNKNEINQEMQSPSLEDWLESSVVFCSFFKFNKEETDNTKHVNEHLESGGHFDKKKPQGPCDESYSLSLSLTCLSFV